MSEPSSLTTEATNIFCNGLYNIEAAKTILQGYIQQEKAGKYQVASMASVDIESVGKVTGDASKRLTFHSVVPPGMSEVHFHVQGIVAAVHLLPLSNRLQGNALQTHQSITITGLGLPDFDNAIDGMLSMFVHFSQHVPPDMLKTWTMPTIESSIGLHSALTFSNPIFLTKSIMAMLDNVDASNITEQMDPQRYLRHRQGDYMYTTDNEVALLEKVNMSSPSTYTPTGLGKVRVGDIVEVRFSLYTTFQSRQSQYQLRPALRAIVRHDSSVQQAMSKAMLRAKYHVDLQGQVLKHARKRGVESNADNDVDRELKRVVNGTEAMHIDPPNM